MVETDRKLYIEATIHKSRVLRNFESFEESNKLLEELTSKIDGLPMSVFYNVVIERLYNLCWNSQIREAYALANEMIEKCSRTGDIKTKAWFERYLTAIHFFAGRMKETVYYYEKSLELPKSERLYLERHSVGMYAAKAYQMLGDENKAVAIISEELQRLRSTGRFEEMWAAYLLAAEIHHVIAYIDMANGGNSTYSTAVKYFTLAHEYAPLYRKTEFQTIWVKMLRLVGSIMFSSDPKEPIIDEIFIDFDKAGDFLKTIILGRVSNYYALTGDFIQAVKYAIEIGEKADAMLVPVVAYGFLAIAAMAKGDREQALFLTKRLMELSHDKGMFVYFKVKQGYGPLLEFALENDITPDFTKEMIKFGSHKFKKVYIRTLGGFTVTPYKNRQEPSKMRTKKERELFAFLLDAGNDGVTKEQIYNAIWSESESEDVKKLNGVNLAQIKKDLAGLDVENPIISHERHYSICRDEIVLDIDLFEEAMENFRLQKNNESAQKLLSLYKGDYLSDFEALWAIAKRIKYREAYEQAVSYCSIAGSNKAAKEI